MERTWIYRDDLGKDYGPYSREELERYAREGRVSHQGTVREGEGPWLAPEAAGLDLPPVQDPPVGAAAHPALDSAEAVRRAKADIRTSPHQRVIYILLGVLLPFFGGIAGINNLIVGRTSNGVIQLTLGIVAILSGILGGIFFFPICLAIPLWLGVLVWSIVEACTNTLDGEGRVMQ